MHSRPVLFTLAFLLGVLLPAGPAPAAELKRPNILFLFADDHAYQAISAYGDPRKLIETRHIDRLAREGMRFDRCLVPNSICGPSRATILTGTYNHINGFYNNTNCRFDGSQDTFPRLLRAAGYQTAVVGKWHLVSAPTGFDHWEILPGQGRYHNPPMIRNGRTVQHPGYVTDVITDLSLDWLKKRDRSKPFLLMCQHKAPHREWEPAVKYLGHDRDRTYPPPPTFFDDYSGRGKAEHDQDMTIAKTMNDRDVKLVPPQALTPEQRKAWDAYYGPRNEAFRKAKPQGKELVRWKYNRYLHDYLGCIRSVDESVGRLLKYLDDEGLADNTLVVYSSDQGFYLGEHGWFDKRWIFEESLRTPLLVRWPGAVKAGGVCRDIVSNLDFAETFLDAAGVKVPAGMQGRSLVPILRGQTPADWRKSFYYHYYEYPQPHHVRPHYGVVTDRYKLVHFYRPDVDYWELFDREKDPRELRSVYGKPEYAGVQKQLHREIDHLRTELREPAQAPPRAYGNVKQKEIRPPLKKDDARPERRPEPGRRDSRPSILVLMADDWAWPHAGAYGDRVVRTPTFDRIAREGMLFQNAFCVSPSCTPSRAAMLTGQAIHRLGESGNLWSTLGKEHACYPDLLERAGYHVGLTGKGWGPGSLKGSGRARNPAGPEYRSFADFLASVPERKPFCFWFGSRDPHRPYVKGSGVRSGLNPDRVRVPPYLPDTHEVRSDICDYYHAVERFDRDCADILARLEKAGRLDNTLILITGDNGWPFPRGKANLYDAGTHQPLAVRWPARVRAGRVSDALISFQDFAPTFLEAAGRKPPADMTGRSFLDLLTTGKSAQPRDRVFLERERHANVRAGDLGYPCRAVRTREFLYVRNFHPERWPAGDPQMWKAVGPFGDIDGGPTKDILVEGKNDPWIGKFFRLACGKRPAEELYDLARDPYERMNLADRPEYARTRKQLRAELQRWMKQTADPRAGGTDGPWDRYPYRGPEAPARSKPRS